MRNFSSLLPISQVYSTESMYVGNQIQYAGFLKRDSGLLSLWNARYFTLRIMGFSQITLNISKNREGEGSFEQVILLSSVKITNKCTQIQKYPCFGFVLSNGKKYLISLPNIHQCQKFHAQLIYIKKMAKQLKKKSVDLQKTKELQVKHQKQKSSTNQENDQISQSQESQMLNRINRQKLKLKRSNQQHTFIQDYSRVFQTNLRQAPTSIYFQDIETSHCNCSNFFSQIQDHILASNQKFMPHPSLQLQKILVNQQNILKNMIIFNTTLSLNSCIQSFLQLSSWNAQVKKTKILQKRQNTFILYIQFIKNITANKNRCVIAEVSMKQNDYCASLRIQSAKRAQYEFINSKKEVQMELIAKIVIDRSNKLQKIMTIALSIKPSREQFDLGIKFMKETRNFQSKFIN